MVDVREVQRRTMIDCTGNCDPLLSQMAQVAGYRVLLACLLFVGGNGAQCTRDHEQGLLAAPHDRH